MRLITHVFINGADSHLRYVVHAYAVMHSGAPNVERKQDIYDEAESNSVLVAFTLIVIGCERAFYRNMRNSFVLIMLLSLNLGLNAVANDVPLNLAETPLFTSGGKTALVQLVVQRDNNLFFEAYPSYVDIDGDGAVDIKYKPGKVDYLGYFGENLCYSLTSGDHLSATSIAIDKKCAGTWSGDFLNYATMTRMDLMLRTLYGGSRSVDSSTETRLRRAFVPWENHTWGVEYESEAVDGYKISDYTPFAAPEAGMRHHFATNNFERNDVPYLRVRTNQNTRIWKWVDKAAVQGDGDSNLDLPLDVKVCNPLLLEDYCQQYPNGQFKPVGLLHEYSDGNTMLFSLITGSFENNKRGGVLRQPMAPFAENEVDPDTGIFIGIGGIIKNLDAIQIPNDYNEGTEQNDCGFLWDRPFVNGECRAWGNPVAEMMYEGMRYLAGEKSPSSEFETSGGVDETLGLNAPIWDDPYAAEHAYAQCANSYQLVISDPSPSYDGDQLPGSDFGAFTGSGLDGLHVGNIADFISANDSSVQGLKFIGEAGAQKNTIPSAKLVTTLRDIRGVSPEAPHRQGSYYSSSISYFGHQNDIHPDAPGVQTVGNFTLALGSQLPTIDVEVAGNTISFAPFGKTVSLVDREFTSYYPTDAIVGFNIEYLTDTTGSFRVSFEDNEQGADNDLDAIVVYSYEIIQDEVVMTVDSIEAAGSAIQHMGFAVSGSTNDGVYLLVRDKETKEIEDHDFVYDVPPGASPGAGWNDGVSLPLKQVLTFAPSTAPSAEQMKSPLWYAAKWGGFNDINEDGIPQDVEWDADSDGNPDNYFPVVSPAKMDETLRSVFEQIREQSATGTSVGVTSSSLGAGSRVYQADFVSGIWTGDLTSRAISTDGEIDVAADWSAEDRLVDKINANTRQILTFNRQENVGVAFEWPDNPLSPAADEISADQTELLSLNPYSAINDGLGEQRLRYIRGEAFENFRVRSTTLGDIVHSNPQLVGEPSYYYPDNWGDAEPENIAPYSTFARNNRDRRRVVYVGANDGMLHAFDAGTATDGVYSAGTGDELFAYVPAKVFSNLPDLTHPRYSHKYYVDGTPRIGDAFNGTEWRTVLVSGLRRGGQGFFALDITDPESIDQSSADETVLWEFSDEDDADMGYSYGTPLITRMNNGKWAAIISNGYGSTENDGNVGSGQSVIYVLDLFTGEVLAKLATDNTLGNHNGMSVPTAVDLDGNNTVDLIYAGDLAGYVHAFDVSSPSASAWETKAELTSPLFSAQDNDGNQRAITSGISVGSHPTQAGLMLYFGTGKYLELGDRAINTEQNRLYGLWDNFDSGQFNLSDPTAGLVQQSITAETTEYLDFDNDGVTDTTVQTRTSTKNTIDWETDKGWYVDLMYPSANGEQVIANPVLRDGRLFLSTHAPSGDQCSTVEDGWLMVFNPRSGAMLDESPFDLDGDGIFDESKPLSGFKNGANPFAEPTFAAAVQDDVVISQGSGDTDATSRDVKASINSGTLTWRELEP